jgi:LacI family transcriptional regulator
MRRIEEFCCQNSDCPDHGQRGAGNLRWHGWSSKRQGIRMLYCRTCGSYFSQRKGSALWQCRLRQQKAISVLQHIAEGCGVRQTARLAKVDKNTVCRLVAVAGDQAGRMHDELVAFSPGDE